MRLNRIVGMRTLKTGLAVTLCCILTRFMVDNMFYCATACVVMASGGYPESYKKGIEMTLKKAESALANLNVTAVDAVGEAFDPALHNRIMQEEIPGTEPGIVAKQFQKGYKLGEKVIRHRTVSVSC